MTFRLSKSSTEAFREHFPCSLFSILGDFNTRICGFVAAFQFSNLEIDVLAFPFPNKNNRKATLCCYFEKETLTRGNCHLCDKESREEQKQTPKLTCFMSRDEWKLYYSSLTTFVFLSENDTHLDQNYTREREKRTQGSARQSVRGRDSRSHQGKKSQNFPFNIQSIQLWWGLLQDMKLAWIKRFLHSLIFWRNVGDFWRQNSND